MDFLDDRGLNESNLKANLMEKYPKIVALYNTRDKALNQIISAQKSNNPPNTRGRPKANRSYNFLCYTNSA